MTGDPSGDLWKMRIASIGGGGWCQREALRQQLSNGSTADSQRGTRWFGHIDREVLFASEFGKELSADTTGHGEGILLHGHDGTGLELVVALTASVDKKLILFHFVLNELRNLSPYLTALAAAVISAHTPAVKQAFSMLQPL